MNAKAAIQLVVEGAAPPGWQTTRGVYANYSRWPHAVIYYIKCPKCGLVHGDFDTLRAAWAQKLCNACNAKAIDKLKDEIAKTVADPRYQPKKMTKIMGEAEETGAPDGAEAADDLPLDTPAPVPGAAPEMDDPGEEAIRLLAGNWVFGALRDFAEKENIDEDDIVIDDGWSEDYGYDPAHPEAARVLKVLVGNKEYLIFRNNDEAEAFTLNIIRDDLESEPDIFNQDWLRSFIDQDRLAREIGDPYEDWEDEVNSLDYEELLERLEKESYVDYADPVFYKKNGEPRVKNKVRAKALDAVRDEYIEKEKPAVNPMDYMEEMYGKEQAAAEALKMAGFDVDAAAKSALQADGWPHFINRWDGNSEELENGAVYCRQ
jgi:hypothetical protein